MKFTAIYSTANVEKVKFEHKVRENILSVGERMPLISVSQRPIKFGKNICVGIQGATYPNLYRQLQIATEEAKTEYVTYLSADTLYPPGFFQFNPTDKIHVLEPIWVLNEWENVFRKKEYADTTCFVKREFALQRLANCLEGRSKWGKGKIKAIFRKRRWKSFRPDLPVVTIKTSDNVSKTTGTIVGQNPVQSLPHWGTAKEVKEAFCLN